MARVTIEDCRKYIPNRFELVIMAAQRAKDLSLGMPSMIQKTRDKDSVLALREIAAGRIDCEKLRILVLSKYVDPMKKSLLSGRTQAELEDIFKELAASVSSEPLENEFEDEEDDFALHLDDCCNHGSSDSEDDDYEDDEEDEQRAQIRHQKFDTEVSFDDADVED